MFELGDDAERMHRDVGDAIRESGVNRLFTFGELSASASEAFGEGAAAYESLESLIGDLTDGLSSDVNVLVKGSRGMRMERVVDAVREAEPMRKGA
jgi:UDP-N-acetylmuramoyl-tripeptide--D-alanyl-D-alanine ligase